MKTCPIVKHFINRRIKILPNTKRTLKNAPKTFKFWQSSEISPNLVTLAGGWGRRCLSSSFLRSPNDQFARLTDNSIIEKKGSCLQTKRLKVNMSERERENGGHTTVHLLLLLRNHSLPGLFSLFLLFAVNYMFFKNGGLMISSPGLLVAEAIPLPNVCFLCTYQCTWYTLKYLIWCRFIIVAKKSQNL